MAPQRDVLIVGSVPLATTAEPHSYDLCSRHAKRLTVPRGWDVVRHEGEFTLPAPQIDDLVVAMERDTEKARAILAAQ